MAGAVPDLRLGAGRDGRELDGSTGIPGIGPQRAATRRRGDPVSRQLPAVRTRYARGAPGRDPCAAGGRHGAHPPPPRHRQRGDGSGDRAGRGLAGHRERARLLDGAGPARRPGRRRLPARRGCPERSGKRRSGGDAVPGPVGQQRSIPGPDAPLAPISQRHNRIDGQRAVHAVRGHRGDPDLAELRDVPLGVRAGRPTRRRSGRPPVARSAGVLLPMVAAGNPVPLEHEVPTRVGATLCVLRGRPPRPAGRHRIGDRRRLSGAAVFATERTAAHRTTHLGSRESGGDGVVAPRRHCPRPQRVAGRPARGRRRAAAARTGAGADGQAQVAAGQRRRRLSRRPGAEPHRRAGRRRRRRRRRDGGRAGVARPRLRRRAVRPAA